MKRHCTSRRRVALSSFVILLIISLHVMAYSSTDNPKSTLRSLRSKSFQARKEAIHQFKFLVAGKKFARMNADPEVKSMLKDLVDQDDDGDVRAQAIIALTKIQDPATASSFEEWANHGKSRNTRIFAIQGLAQIEGLAAISPLKKLFQEDPDIFIRFKAGQELGKLGDSSAYLFAMEKLGDKDGVIRSEAAETLGTIGKPEALTQLRQVVAKNDDSSVSALEALDEIGLRQMSSIDTKLDFLKKSLYSSNASCGWAAKKLGEMKTKESIQILLDATRAATKYGSIDYNAKRCAEPIFKSLYWDGTTITALKVDTMIKTGIITELPN